jgi:hypothetical protein
MEKLLEKAVVSKGKESKASVATSAKAEVARSEAAARAEEKIRLENGYKEDARKTRLEKAGFKFVKVPKTSRLQSRINRIRRPSFDSFNSVKLKHILSNKRDVAFLVAIFAVAAIAIAYVSGMLNFGLTGFATQPKTMYVCADGSTTVENLTMCPTTTTTTTSTTTTTTTTTIPTTTTTTIPTTTTTIGAKHTIAITEASCSGKIITMKIQNVGPVTENTAYINFYVDGTKDSTFLCSGGVVGPGEQTPCISGMQTAGSHEVEARGLVNIVDADVTC